MDKENYNYIMEHDAPKRSFLQLNSTKQRIFFVLAIGIVGLLIIMFFVSILSGGKPSSRELLYQVSANQADILQITKLGSTEARDVDVINYITTTNAVVSSHNVLIQPNFQKGDDKKIALLQTNDIQKTLEEAKQAGTYDKTISTLLNNQLDLYQQSLITAYDQTQSANLKKDLAKMYTDIKTIRDDASQEQKTN